MAFSISINGGAPLDAEANLISVTQRVQANQEVGQVSLKISRTPDQPFLFERQQFITILRAGVPWFQGVSMSATKRDTAEDMGHLHVIKDGWHILKDSPFRSTIALPTLGAYTTSAWTMMQAFVASAIPQWLTLPNWPANLPVIGWWTWPLVNGQTVEGITRLLRPDLFAATAWIPGATSAIPPTMRLTTRGDVVRTLYRKGPFDPAGVTEIELTPDGDSAPSAVELWSSNGEPWRGQMDNLFPFAQHRGEGTFYPTGATPGGYQNAMLIDPGTASFTTWSVKPIGLAGAMFSVLSQIIWRGSFVYQDAGCFTGLRPGDTVNFVDDGRNPFVGAGWDPEWADCRAVIQTVTEDPLTGKTTCTLGISGGLTPKSVFEKVVNWLGARRWPMLSTSRAFQAPDLQIGAGSIAVPLPGSGPGSASIHAVGDDGITLTGRLNLSTRNSGLSGTDLVEVFYNIATPDPSAGPLLTVTANNAATTALTGFTVTQTAFGFTLSADAVSIPEGSGLEWLFTLTPPTS